MTIAFVQSASNTGTGTTITVTLSGNTTASNCLVVGSIASGGTNPTITGITLGGAAGNFSAMTTVPGAGDTTTSAGLVEIWADPNCAGGQTSVVVTYSAASASGGAVWVYEFSGMASSSILDKRSMAFTTSTQATFNSGTTGTTTQASELWFGAAGGFNTTITGPASPWVNSSMLTSNNKNLIVGYDIVSSTGTAVYSGTYSPNSFEEAAVVTLLGAAAGPAAQPIPYLSQYNGMF